jgi:histidine triad (HIT) family protein
MESAIAVLYSGISPDAMWFSPDPRPANLSVAKRPAFRQEFRAMPRTLFERIIDREIPAKIEHEDDRCIVIHDIQPQAPVHLLIIPKKAIPRLADAASSDEAVLGHLLVVAGELARKLHLERGFRIVVNSGPDACESVPHVHVHLLAKRQMAWPPG